MLPDHLWTRGWRRSHSSRDARGCGRGRCCGHLFCFRDCDHVSFHRDCDRVHRHLRDCVRVRGRERVRSSWSRGRCSQRWGRAVDCRLPQVWKISGKTNKNYITLRWNFSVGSCFSNSFLRMGWWASLPKGRVNFWPRAKLSLGFLACNVINGLKACSRATFLDRYNLG